MYIKNSKLNEFVSNRNHVVIVVTPYDKKDFKTGYNIIAYDVAEKMFYRQEKDFKVIENEKYCYEALIIDRLLNDDFQTIVSFSTKSLISGPSYATSIIYKENDNFELKSFDSFNGPHFESECFKGKYGRLFDD